MQKMITLSASVNEAPAIIEVMRLSNYWLFEMGTCPYRKNHVILTFEYRK